MMLVVPPQAAAMEPVFQSSEEVVPMKGMSMWVWGSMAPGRMYFPAASTVSSAFSAESGSHCLDDVSLDEDVRREGTG